MLLLAGGWQLKANDDIRLLQSSPASLIEQQLAVGKLLDQADAPGKATDTRLLLNAAGSYQRTKDLLSVIELDAEQTSQFEERLAALQARLLGRA